MIILRPSYFICKMRILIQHYLKCTIIRDCYGHYRGFPCGSEGKEFTGNVGDLVSIPGLERYTGGGHGNPLQYSCLENPQGQRSRVGYIQSMALQGVGHNWASHTQGHYRLTWSITWVWGLDSQFLERERMSLPAEPQGAGALGQPRGMEWGGRREECSGWGTHVYLWQIHFDIWQNQYNIVKFKKKKKKGCANSFWYHWVTD